MAAADHFEITVAGQGAHAAMPHARRRPGAGRRPHRHRRAEPDQPRHQPGRQRRRLSIEAGTAFNVIPDSAVLRGTVRTFSEETQARIREQFDRIVTNTAAAFGATAALDYRPGYPPTVNTEPEARVAAAVAARVVGEDNVVWAPPRPWRRRISATC
ncbi:peptidase dimerization domain-containing protein [Azospirillum thermophilum]|uniref:peptidase dimerization domain-containing protein n=1 Tax=Azospirillum thermophilum TaxID=2202148 RepID=UPI00267A401B